MTQQDGGAAFPSSTDRENEVFVGYTGMRLRDYFAAAALTGLLAQGKEKIMEGATHISGVEAAYKLADSMLVERAKCK